MIKIRKERFLADTYNKLQPMKMGIFPMIKCINDNAYIIRLPPSLNFFNIFNVSDLYKYKPPDDGWVQLFELKTSSSEVEET